MNENNKIPPNAVIIDVKETDFIAGAETGIGTQTPLTTYGQYDEFLPDEETQYDYRFDTFACVSFSALNDLETVFNLKYATGMFGEKEKQWLKDNGYVDYRTGKINFADRFTAKMSGTSQNGNSLGIVGDSARNHGLVPESAWSWPKEMSESMTPEQKWSLYYAFIPQNIKDMGLKFRDMFDIGYQWVILNTPEKANDIIKTWLPYGPIQIASAVCPPWNSTDAMPPIQGCGCTTQHATMIYGYQDGVSLKDFDHYRSYRKQLAWNYCIPYAMQYYVNVKTTIKPVPPLVNLSYGAPDTSATREMQTCLQYLGYMTKGVFGPFGPQTRTALAKYQVASGIVDSPQGTHYGPRTRASMIADINKV